MTELEKNKIYKFIEQDKLEAAIDLLKKEVVGKKHFENELITLQSNVKRTKKDYFSTKYHRKIQANC